LRVAAFNLVFESPSSLLDAWSQTGRTNRSIDSRADRLFKIDEILTLGPFVFGVVLTHAFRAPD
jgi:hypothetical protein